ncbi:hypothetical protein CRYUN_Cryun01aG0215100 [Craigia yunnanensis]
MRIVKNEFAKIQMLNSISKGLLLELFISHPLLHVSIWMMLQLQPQRCVLKPACVRAWLFDSCTTQLFLSVLPLPSHTNTLTTIYEKSIPHSAVGDIQIYIAPALILGFMLLRRLAVVVPRSTRFVSSKDSHDLARTIAELNKEMDSVFGEPPPAGFANSGNKSFMGQESQHNSHVISVSGSNKFTAQELYSISQNVGENAPGLTHVGSMGKAQMVAVSPKENSSRIATASCKVVLGVFDLVLANQMAKGDVLSVAKIAGINGAKHTSTLIPLCHNITLTHVRVDLRFNPEDFSVEIEGEAASTGKTGVEMEATTAVSVAGLTVYDMCKAATKDIQITDIRLERKTGGKSGYWCREE